MTTRLYIVLISGVSAVVVFGVISLAAVKQLAQLTPQRPHLLSRSAVWRPTPSDDVQFTPHGDWIDCRQRGQQDYCVLTDARGSVEFEGGFTSLPERRPVPGIRLRPVTSDTIQPWMWSNHAGRLVPIIHLEDGTVLAPSESAVDLRAYVERMLKFSARLKPVPLYAELAPSAAK